MSFNCILEIIRQEAFNFKGLYDKMRPMEYKTRIIIIGAAVISIIVLVGMVIIYWERIFQNKTVDGDNSLSGLPVISSAPVDSTAQGDTQPASVKSFTSPLFDLNYPSTWGILTCSNSQNIEFDPINSADVKNILCDRAVKPITILVVNRLNCLGETMKLGSFNVVKSKTVQGEDILYRWCFMAGSNGLDITHRVSPSGAQATSKEDFSPAIEKMIATVK